MLGFVSRALLLLLVARMAVVPPTRPTGRSDHFPTGRVLLRYCGSPGPLRWPNPIGSIGGDDAGAAADERGRSPGEMIRRVWPLAAPATPGFLIRPPSHLLC